VTDLLERLRKPELRERSVSYPTAPTDVDLEAANEIERLRNALRKELLIAADLAREIERLRAENEELRRGARPGAASPGERWTCAEGASHPVNHACGCSTARDWPEDFRHENGNYMNTCSVNAGGCGKEFLGYKRRYICKVCSGKGLASHAEPVRSTAPKTTSSPQSGTRNPKRTEDIRPSAGEEGR
jgi:hypothetical protein